MNEPSELEPTALGDDALIERVALAEAQMRLVGRATPVRVGRYVILQRIGKGGMGEVCAAYDPELDRKVAVKLLRADLGLDPGARARLLREARALARLAHPNVVAVHDAGVIGRDVFIVMELVAGETLSSWMRTASRDWRPIRELMLQAGRGLVAAHEAGIVHRDFKPSNVLVSRSADHALRACVLDFGLARTTAIDEPREVTGSEPPHEVLHTRTGIVMGTPAYMAPEQIVGGDVGPAVDQFAFCVALFEMLYGMRPFPEGDLVGRLYAIQSARVASPPATATVPAWLHRAILRGLLADPRQRFASMKELLVALQLDRRKRRRGLALTAVALAIATTLGLAGAWWLRPAPDHDVLAQVERLVDEAHASAARAYFVYAPYDDPTLPSAYQKVLELEGVGELGEARATALRDEFATTLLRLGDEYWQREGGAPFAADYYAQALVFAPELARARERTSLTPGESAALVDKAARGDWTAGERLAGESLAALATDDPELRRERVDALVDGDPAPSPSTSARLLALVGEPEPEVERVPIASARAPRRGERTAVDEVVIVDDEPAPDAATDGSPAIERADDATARDDRSAARWIAEARTAAARGEASRAESLFRRALTHDARSADALAGLGALAYDRGHYHAAHRFARDAVRYAPRSGAHRVLLGDTHFKTHEYAAAQRQYEAAERLGHPEAAARLALLRRELGD